MLAIRSSMARSSRRSRGAVRHVSASGVATSHAPVCTPSTTAARTLRNVVFSGAMKMAARPGTAGATFYDVVFPVAEPDTQYTVFTSTRWLTTCSIGSYSTTGFRITFGSACPVGGSNLDWLIIR